MLSFYKFNRRYIFLSLTLTFFTSFTIAYLLRLQSMPYFFKIKYKSSVQSVTQLFYNTGSGYNEKESIKYQVAGSNLFEEMIFRLPTKKIYGIRLDPLINEGEFHIQSAYVCGRKKLTTNYKILHEFNTDTIVAVAETSISTNNDGSIVIEVPSGATDPIVEIPLPMTLDHWEFIDFLDKKWLIDSGFITFLLLPLIITNPLFSAKKNSVTKQTNFIFNKNYIKLEDGETFRAPIADSCYRDTSTGTLRTIIEEIQSGKNWKQAVKDKFRKNNTWLCDIITSPKRTKFLDEFIKPKGLRILDIGAGWGQFSIPLARKNFVCALEPTPERLDFIKAVSDQENLANKLSFICANYQDIKFQKKFDLILSIGVLEWVGKFYPSEKSPESAQLEFLMKTKKDLTEEGKLVIGIENRLGLKYLLGANDDHTGLPHISYFRNELAKTKFKQKTNQELECFTYSLAEYKSVLHRAGFSTIKFYASLPDYKLPREIFPISKNLSKCDLNNAIQNGRKVDEHDGTNGKKLENQEDIYSMYMSLAEMEIAHYFAPSFFIEAS